MRIWACRNASENHSRNRNGVGRSRRPRHHRHHHRHRLRRQHLRRQHLRRRMWSHLLPHHRYHRRRLSHRPKRSRHRRGERKVERASRPEGVFRGSNLRVEPAVVAFDQALRFVRTPGAARIFIGGRDVAEYRVHYRPLRLDGVLAPEQSRIATQCVA
jgi:hypothetical protein